MNAIEWIFSIKFASSYSSSIFQAASWAYIDSQYSKTLHKKAQKTYLSKPFIWLSKCTPKNIGKFSFMCKLEREDIQETSNAIKFKVHIMQISCQVLHVGWRPRSRHQPKVGMPLGECHAPRAFLFLKQQWDQALQIARIASIVGTYTYGLHCVFIADASGACPTTT